MAAAGPGPGLPGDLVPMEAAWDPTVHTAAAPTASCKRRIMKDLSTLYRDPLPGIVVIEDPAGCTNVVHALVHGPEGTPYEGGFFYFIVQCPADFPFEPPRVKNLTTGQGTVRFNPNLYANGKVCLSILGTWSGPGWKVSLTIGGVLLSIQSLLNHEPYRNEPGFSDSASPLQIAAYNTIILHETIRVAVIAMADSRGPMAKVLPAAFRSNIGSLFMCSYRSYVRTCERHLPEDGLPMNDPFGEPRGNFRWKELLQQLHQLKQQLIAEGVEEMDEDSGDEGGAAAAAGK
eukprot:TRINITY_DN16518_c0_g1_i3.p1 TRINITY_DN16518_c0_g1~~TRINITY_DN16518_c0_g1_i3.p1  ORF type:complete len:317 (+),score=97.63 TRINITY_DN16518_c0_g1_i3:86-952(+)